MADYEGSSTVLVGDVDCEDAGKELCKKFKVASRMNGGSGIPSIKFGEVGDLTTASANTTEEYNGERTYEDLKKFVYHKMACVPASLEYCSEADKAKLEVFMKMSEGKLEGRARNMHKVLVEDVPVMRKVLAYRRCVLSEGPCMKAEEPAEASEDKTEEVPAEVTEANAEHYD